MVRTPPLARWFICFWQMRRSSSTPFNRPTPLVRWFICFWRSRWSSIPPFTSLLRSLGDLYGSGRGLLRHLRLDTSAHTVLDHLRLCSHFRFTVRIPAHAAHFVLLREQCALPSGASVPILVSQNSYFARMPMAPKIKITRNVNRREMRFPEYIEFSNLRKLKTAGPTNYHKIINSKNEISRNSRILTFQSTHKLNNSITKFA